MYPALLRGLLFLLHMLLGSLDVTNEFLEQPTGFSHNLTLTVLLEAELGGGDPGAFAWTNPLNQPLYY